MPNSCASLGCKYSRINKDGDKKHSFHLFPKNKVRRARWLANLNRVGYSLHARSGLCSQHFTDDCFDLTGQTVRLRDFAVPTIFEHAPSSKQLTKQLPQQEPQQSEQQPRQSPNQEPQQQPHQQPSQQLNQQTQKQSQQKTVQQQFEHHTQQQRQQKSKQPQEKQPQQWPEQKLQLKPLIATLPESQGQSQKHLVPPLLTTLPRPQQQPQLLLPLNVIAVLPHQLQQPLVVSHQVVDNDRQENRMAMTNEENIGALSQSASSEGGLSKTVDECTPARNESIRVMVENEKLIEETLRDSHSELDSFQEGHVEIVLGGDDHNYSQTSSGRRRTTKIQPQRSARTYPAPKINAGDQEETLPKRQKLTKTSKKARGTLKQQADIAEKKDEMFSKLKDLCDMINESKDLDDLKLAGSCIEKALSAFDPTRVQPALPSVEKSNRRKTQTLLLMNKVLALQGNR